MGGLRSGRDRITQQIWRPQQPSIPHRHSHRHSPPPSSSTPVPASFAPPSPSPQSLLHQEHTTDSSTSTEAMACAAAAAAVSSGLSSLASSKSGLNGVSVAVSAPRIAPATARSFAVRASKSEESETVSRRAALALVAGVVAAGARIAPANAAYGESANVFGAPKVQTGFTPYTGSGFSVEIPSKWNPSKEKEFPGTVLRYEDNFDATNNLFVSITPAAKGSITDYGPPEKFLDEVSYLLGKQSYSGKTSSEGGFLNNAVATASVLDAASVTVNGRPYYKLSVLTRTADGDEGGKHQLIAATVKDGKLYLLKAQAGDKRWFKGVKKFVEGSWNSFTVA